MSMYLFSIHVKESLSLIDSSVSQFVELWLTNIQVTLDNTSSTHPGSPCLSHCCLRACGQATVSRARAKLDLSLMLLRRKNWAATLPAQPTFIQLRYDSSPVKKDLFLIQELSIAWLSLTYACMSYAVHIWALVFAHITSESELPNQNLHFRSRYDKAIQLHELQMQDTDVLEVLADDKQDEMSDQDFRASCSSALQTRLLPPSCLGSAHTTLPDKISALIHSLKLECGESLRHYLRAIAACTSDQGMRRNGL